MAYHCEHRDPDLGAKTRDVPLLHEQPSFRFDEDGDPVPWEEGQEARVLSHDERPGTRDAREHRTRPTTRRGRRTRSAARQGHGQARPRAREARDAPRPADLPAGEATPLAGETREGPDHAGFPGITGGRYPKGDLTRIVPGDVSARTSAETRRHPPCVPGLLEFVSAPRHGSWPDLVEGLISKTARQMLRGIRVSSKDEPEERILRYLREVSAEPVVYRWRWNLSDMGPTAEGLVVDTLLPDGADKAS